MAGLVGHLVEPCALADGGNIQNIHTPHEAFWHMVPEGMPMSGDELLQSKNKKGGRDGEDYKKGQEAVEVAHPDGGCRTSSAQGRSPFYEEWRKGLRPETVQSRAQETACRILMSPTPHPAFADQESRRLDSSPSRRDPVEAGGGAGYKEIFFFSTLK